MVTGLELTQKSLLQAFETNNLRRVAPMPGEAFDPHLHQAMMEQSAGDVAPGSVLQVMQAGYELMGRIVRPAMVIVADKASGAGQATNAYSAHNDDAGGAVDTKA